MKFFYRYLTLCLTAVLTVTSFVGNAEAAVISGRSDIMSSSLTSTVSSHTIKFTTPTGASENTDTIVVRFPLGFDLTGKSITTVGLSHGPTTGLENSETLASSSTPKEWGAVFSGPQSRVLTLSAPTDGVGAASISASSRIVITLSNANCINPPTLGVYPIDISGTFGDLGLIFVGVHP